MTDRASFEEAIRRAPEDEALRLVFADWLEEHGDPLADFIRLQFQLEPLRNVYHDEHADGLRKREEEFLQEHRPEWLGPLTAQESARETHTQATFRGGLVEKITTSAWTFLEHAEEWVAMFPALRELVLFGVQGRGAELAACPPLGAFRHVEIADWIAPADAIVLARSPHLAEIRTLLVWLGHRDELPVARALARIPQLRELRLLQLYGGLAAEDPPAANDRADEVAAQADAARSEPIAHVVRPFDRLFPIWIEPWCDMVAGRTSDGRQLLACGAYPGDLELIFFDTRGEPIGEEVRELMRIFPDEQPSWIDADTTDVIDYLRQEFGFEPAMIHVKEFRTEAGTAVYLYPATYAEFIANPDETPDIWIGEAEAVGMAILHRWLEDGNFVIEFGNDAWAGPDGVIHST